MPSPRDVVAALSNAVLPPPSAAAVAARSPRRPPLGDAEAATALLSAASLPGSPDPPQPPLPPLPPLPLLAATAASPASATFSSLLPSPAAPPVAGARLAQAALTAAAVLGYGASLYVNGLSGRALSPAAGLVLLGATRGLFEVALCMAMLATGRAPPEYRRGGAGRPVSLALLAPAFVGVFANAGFMPYSALVAGGEVSVLAPMCGVYSVVPVIFGLVVMRERRGWKKLLGIALSLGSVLLLAFSGFGGSGGGEGGGASAGTLAEKAALFLLVVLSWGGGDCMAAYLARLGKLSTFEIAASNAAGQFATAAIFGLVAIASGTGLGGGTGGEGSGGVGALSFVGASVVANVLGIVAWLSFTKLGESEGASDFTPVVALYVFVPVVLSAVLLGESLSDPLKVGGLVAAAVAAVLLNLR